MCKSDKYVQVSQVYQPLPSSSVGSTLRSYYIGSSVHLWTGVGSKLTAASKNNSLCYTATNTIILKKKEVERICVISHISETGELTTVVKTCIQEWQMLPSSVQ